MKILVYLDSQDYSNLSAPIADSGRLSEIKQKLIDFSTSNKVQFVFSSVIVTEISPLDKLSTEHARSRAEFLEQLCGRNTFRSLDFLLRTEFQSYGSELVMRDSLISRDGEWFPEVGNIVDGIDLGIDFKSITKKQASDGANRHARRKASAGLIRNGQVRKAVLPQFLAMATGPAVENLRKKYPMKEENLLVLLKHRLGYESRENAIQAFMESFRDPVWMMQWFNSCPDELSTIANLYRFSAVYLCETLSESANDLKANFESARQFDPNKVNMQTMKKMLEKNCNSTLMTLGNKLLKCFGGHAMETVEVTTLNKFCPGFSMFIRAGYAAIWDAVTVQPRILKSNDFMDAMHAFHLPYVDIFRADNYMATQLKKISQGGPQIVSFLKDLPEVIERAIAERENSV